MKILNKFKTNWTLTSRFLATMIFIVIIELIVNLIIWRTTIIYTKKNQIGFSPEKFTLGFSQHINFKDNLPFADEEGKYLITKQSGWIQIIDENAKEVYSYNKPKEVPLKYNPIDIVHIYKYDIANYSVLISEKKYNNQSFSYIIGFPIDRIAKHTITFNPAVVSSFFGKGFFLLLFIYILIAIIISYFLFGKRMGTPLENIISGINELSKGNYEKRYFEQGVYKSVFSNLNNLSETLKENKNKREELEKMREVWISSISHDVKTPLSSIKGYAEIMRDPDYSFSTEEIHEYSDIIYNKSLYIQTLIEDLNLTYKLKNKVVPMNIQELNISLLLQNIIIGILNHPIYSNRSINFYTETDDIKAFVDEKLFKRALTNLIFNSLIHNTEEVQVDVSIYRKDGIHIIIKDTGKGIPKNDLDRIFERYYRGTNTTTSIEGSGLGMAISKQIIDAHGGIIFIESVLDEGTIVKIFLS